MNELIESIFNGFKVDGVDIPVAFMYYEAHDEPYVVYMEQDAGNSLSGDDDLIGYVLYYDFDVFSKGNYFNIVFLKSSNPLPPEYQRAGIIITR